MPRLRVFILMFLAALPLAAQTFDISGNGNLTGIYLFRYVVYGVSTNTGAITEGCSVTGTMTFNGNGSYTVANTQVFDTVSSGGSCSQPLGGSYSLQPNGLAQLDNPLFDSTLFGTFSQPVLSASSTEESLYDVFVAVQAPTSPISNSALQGPYQVGTLEYLNARNSLARQGWFTMNPDGNGNLGSFTVTGSAVNLGTGSITQNISGATYSLSGNGIGSMTIPGSGQGQLVSGTKVLYISADGNYVIGGSTSGVDLVFGFKAAAVGASNALYSGTYFTAGLEGDLSQLGSNFSFLDSFYGGINSNGIGTAIWHQRYNDQVDAATFDYTFADAVTLGPDGISRGNVYTTILGANGQSVMVLGSGTTYVLDIGVRAPAASPGTAPWINPVGISNAANYTPITDSYSGGELVNIYGNFGVAAQGASTIPLPMSLGGVQVLVNKTPAAIYSVGPNSISALIPFGTASADFATFQVVVNGASSNTATLYVNGSAPGLYTLQQNGIGPGALLHADFSPVTDSKPAQPGETVLLFLNGLGTVTPQTADGVAGPSNPLSVVNTTVAVAINDGVHASAQATVAFSGLAPGFPGLYQVNFQVPKTGLSSGTAFLSFETSEATSQMATISLGGFTASAVRASAAGRQPQAKMAAKPGSGRLKGRRVSPLYR